jgi:outer membrane protein
MVWTKIVALTAMTLFCATGLSQQEIKIGFVSLKKISDESLKKKDFEEQVKKMLEERKAERDKIKKEIEDLETAKALSGPEQAKREDERIQQKKLELLRFDSEIRKEIEAKQSVFEKEILAEIGEAVRAVAKEKGYTWVLVDEVLMCRDDSADLTFQTLVKMNDKYIKTLPAEEPKAEEKASSKVEPVSVTVEDELIADVVKGGARNRNTIKEIQPRKGSASGSITMKGEKDRVRFISRFPKDIAPGAGGVISTPMGNKSVWRFIGQVPLSGYVFNGLDENRPLTFMLMEEIGLVHLYGRGSVTYPDGHNVAIEEEQPPPSSDSAGEK